MFLWAMICHFDKCWKWPIHVFEQQCARRSAISEHNKKVYFAMCFDFRWFVFLRNLTAFFTLSQVQIFVHISLSLMNNIYFVFLKCFVMMISVGNDFYMCPKNNMLDDPLFRNIFVICMVWLNINAFPELSHMASISHKE